MRICLIGLCALALSGCAGIPPAVSIATTALDGASWFVSGKTMTDHLVSEAAGADCRLVGLVEDGRICKETPDYEATTVATLQPLPETGTGVRVAAADNGGNEAVELPDGFAYLAAALGDQKLARVAAAGEGANPAPAIGFAAVRGTRGFTGRTGAAAGLGDARYLAAGLRAPAASQVATQ